MTTSAYIPENDLRVKVEFAIGALAQIWKCSFCGNLRQWGLLWPEDKNEKPVLGCRCCRHPMRHEFSGVMSRA